MLLSKLKVVTAVLLAVGVVAAGVGAAGRPPRPARAAERAGPRADANGPAAPADADRPGPDERGREGKGPAPKPSEQASAWERWKEGHVHGVWDHRLTGGQDCLTCHSVMARPPGQAEAARLKDLVGSVREKDRKVVGRAVTVAAAVRGIEEALHRQRLVIPDKEAELRALDEIEEAVREMRKKLREDERGK